MTASVHGSRSKRMRNDDGAALVEFALVMPLFFLLIFGIIEFGWIFSQQLDVRHGAREGGRLIAVDWGDEAGNESDQLAALTAAICDRMDHSSGATITLGLTETPPVDTPPSYDDFATVTIEDDADTITGFLDPMLGVVHLESTIQTRLEQDAHWISDPWADQTLTCP